MKTDTGECIFCGIAQKAINSVVVWEDSDILAFLEIRPLRKGHCQIIPKKHIETFDQMPSELAGKVITLGQRLAQRMKAVYKVDRVAFVFTGGEIPHAHAHVVPMHSENDIIFASDILNPEMLQFDSSRLQVDRDTLVRIKMELAFH